MNENIDLKKIKKDSVKRELIKKILIYTFLSIWCIIILFPFYWMILTSLKGYAEYNSEYIPKFISLEPTLDNYVTAFTLVSLGRYF